MTNDRESGAKQLTTELERRADEYAAKKWPGYGVENSQYNDCCIDFMAGARAMWDQLASVSEKPCPAEEPNLRTDSSATEYQAVTGDLSAQTRLGEAGSIPAPFFQPSSAHRGIRLNRLSKGEVPEHQKLIFGYSSHLRSSYCLSADLFMQHLLLCNLDWWVYESDLIKFLEEQEQMSGANLREAGNCAQTDSGISATGYTSVPLQDSSVPNEPENRDAKYHDVTAAKNFEIIDGKLVRKWQHEPPKAAIVAWCPHCLTYGGPKGIEDRVCGNCGKEGCRMYQEVLPEIIK